MKYYILHDTWGEETFAKFTELDEAVEAALWLDSELIYKLTQPLIKSLGKFPSKEEFLTFVKTDPSFTDHDRFTLEEVSEPKVLDLEDLVAKKFGESYSEIKAQHKKSEDKAEANEKKASGTMQMKHPDTGEVGPITGTERIEKARGLGYTVVDEEQ